MYLEGIVLSEIRQKNPISFHLYVASRKRKNPPSLKKEVRLNGYQRQRMGKRNWRRMVKGINFQLLDKLVLGM